MNSRERVNTALNHEEPDRVPIDLGGSVVTSISILTCQAVRNRLGLLLHKNSGTIRFVYHDQDSRRLLEKWINLRKFMGMLRGKTVLVTGGANGIGEAAVRRFAHEGAGVLFVDVDKTSGSKLESSLLAENKHVAFLCCDVSKSGEVSSAIAAMRDRYGRLDVIYNNASVYLAERDGPIASIEEDIWDKIIGINLKSIFLCCKYGIPLMLENGGGSIINTSSSAGVVGIPRCDAYTATKGATVSLTKSMAVEYGPQGIRVNCIAPAAIHSKMLSKSSSDGPHFDEQRFLRLRSPLRRYGSPDEVVNLALFLASDRSSYINGAIISVDGGITVSGDLAKMDNEL
jgi:NAD(P)-dependent dehydrogenase (short-subunit alcohol dehydrogenase family)